MREIFMYVCLCNGITDHSIREEVAKGAQHLRDVVRSLGLAKDCARCVEAAREVFDEAKSQYDLSMAEQLAYAADIPTLTAA
ncbi:bacterioferritin-associated ferredoxin [Hahella sp. KA22]|nr:bacterioferritin-associated ferredoxin [Hahella sp. KA22]MBU6950936.1 (2Fe-2S)-binding protein [Hahella sp. HN01]QAY52817.1 bacterioferritin-associated ferredoxin [Hahella sp. KA22]